MILGSSRKTNGKHSSHDHAEVPWLVDSEPRSPRTAGGDRPRARRITARGHNPTAACVTRLACSPHPRRRSGVCAAGTAAEPAGRAGHDARGRRYYRRTGSAGAVRELHGQALKAEPGGPRSSTVRSPSGSSRIGPGTRPGRRCDLKLRPERLFPRRHASDARRRADTLRATLTSANTSLSFNSIKVDARRGSRQLVLELNEPNAFIPSDLGSTLVTKPKKSNIGTGPFQISGRQGTNAR